MSQTTDFVTELFLAANKISKVAPNERRRLIERAVSQVRAMREAVGLRGDRATYDMLDAIEATSHEIEKETDQIAAAVLLEAADMIRTLKIVLDAKNEVSAEVTKH